MVQKKRAGKISAVKRSNQLRTRLSKQGKLKKKHNRKKDKTKYFGNAVQKPVDLSDQEKSDSEQDVLEMMENEDISFLKEAVSNKSYSFLRNIGVNGLNSEQRKTKRKRKATDGVDEDDGMENQYEQSAKQPKTIEKKYLLPIKTPHGLVKRSAELEDSEEEIEETTEDHKNTLEKSIKKTSQPFQTNELSVADLLARRQASLQNKKFRIGVLSSGLLENPELKLKNFKPLLDMLEEKDPEVCITVRKLALISLLEVFKDLLPAYQIKHQGNPNVKLKKDVKQLHDYENGLVKAYKMYLQKIEKIISILKKKKGDTRKFCEPELRVAEMALKCLCDILITHPYFNFSKNIINLLVPYLDHPKENIRTMVANTVKEIFKTDKRGEASLDIVRSINRLVKSRSSSIQPDVLLVFLSLRLKDINLDKEKEDELKRKKLMAKKHNVLKLSKRERKRGKRLQELEKELLETKAEENKKSKQQCLTEITKLVFLMYFKILKLDPSSKLLKAALEGLAKFAHCINVEFYHDLVSVLDNLIQNENLGYKEKLCCVQTVFTILLYQGATINIDPLRFYTHLYANIFYLSAGRNHSDLPVILNIADAVLIKRQKHLSLQRLLAFTKRFTTLALQVLPNGSLGLLCIIKQILQVNKATDVLLDDDSSIGQGIYFPELEEPEYCNASATALYELLPLQRHYHPTVQEYARTVAKVNSNPADNSSMKGFFKHSPEQLYADYDAGDVKFNPAVPAPKKFASRRHLGIMSAYLDDYIQEVLSKVNGISEQISLE